MAAESKPFPVHHFGISAKMVQDFFHKELLIFSKLLAVPLPSVSQAFGKLIENSGFIPLAWRSQLVIYRYFSSAFVPL